MFDVLIVRAVVLTNEQMRRCLLLLLVQKKKGHHSAMVVGLAVVEGARNECVHNLTMMGVFDYFVVLADGADFGQTLHLHLLFLINLVDLLLLLIRVQLDTLVAHAHIIHSVHSIFSFSLFIIHIPNIKISFQFLLVQFHLEFHTAEAQVLLLGQS